MTVNYIKHVNAAIDYFHRTPSIQANHISLYLALFYDWNQNFFHYEFPINRQNIMLMGKIHSYKTYLRRLKELHNYGLITYSPGYGIITPAIISVTLWNDDGELIIPHGFTRVVFTLGKGNYHSKNGAGNQGKKANKPGYKRPPFNKQYINNVKPESENSGQNPSQDEIEKYFHDVGHSEKEARKFYFHHQARDWTINGNPITDWQSAAQKWMESEVAKPGNLHVNQNKRYDIPL